MTKSEAISALKQVSAALVRAEQEMYDLDHLAADARVAMSDAQVNLASVMSAISDGSIK